MKDLTDEDARAINARMAQIARENEPLVSRMDSMTGADLDQIGYYNSVPRNMAESDFEYRQRLKTTLCV